jgi:hypothetical protein
VTSRYEFIDGEKATLSPTGEKKYTVTKMCLWMEVSKSGFTNGGSVRRQRRGGLS